MDKQEANEYLMPDMKLTARLGTRPRQEYQITCVKELREDLYLKIRDSRGGNLPDSVDIPDTPHIPDHCALLLGEGHTDGVLYANGSAGLLPDARVFLERGIRNATDRIIERAWEETGSGSRSSFSFDDIQRDHGLFITTGNGIGDKLCLELRTREELSGIFLDLVHRTLSFELQPGQRQSRDLPLGPDSVSAGVLEELRECAVWIARTALHNTDSGYYYESYDHIREETDFDLERNPMYRDIVLLFLRTLPEVTDVRVDEECFDLGLDVNKCPLMLDYDRPLLRDLMSIRWEDVHLTHKEYENDPAVIDLHEGLLSDDGKTAWADVLNARVERVFEGVYGLQMEVSGIDYERLDAFSHMILGDHAAMERRRWLREETRQEPGCEMRPGTP